MGKSSKAPPAPDYAGAAKQQAMSQYVPTVTPYGTQDFTRNSNSPSGVKSKITLTPDAQATLDSQMAMSRGLAGIANEQMPGISDFYSRPLDLQSLSDPAYQAITSRLNPTWEAREESQRQRLANQGLTPGGEAYENSMREFNTGRNDAYQQAALASLNNASQFYNMPLNTFNALRTGAQVQNPQFQQYAQAPYGNAAQAQGQFAQGLYNADVGQQNAMMGGLFGLGSAGLSAYGLMNAAPAALAISDRRLKSNIVRVGEHPLGIGIYEYDIFGERQRGVMADEVEKVRPEAVVEIGGFKHVNYGML